MQLVITAVVSFVADLAASFASSVFAVSVFEKWPTEVNYPASTKCQNKYGYHC